MKRYPCLEINLSKLENNITEMQKRCNDINISIAGVIKGCTGDIEVAKIFEKCNVSYLASSRIDQLINIKNAGIKTPLMMIRIPMKSEVEDIVSYCNVSLNSEVEVLKLLNEESLKQNKIHDVILMRDLGDLREGFIDNDSIVECSLLIEKDLKNLHLLGIGTNLGCYGAVAATTEKLNELVECAEKIEESIGRKLEIISGGATTSLPRVLEDNMPERINNLRLGEGILLAKDLKDLWGYDMSFMYQDVFKLRAEVIEVKNKFTHPIGEIMFDAFGNQPEYVDRGIRRRALIALGKVDYAFIDDLIINEENVTLVGASSDHTILDIEDATREIKVGDIISFDLCYATMVYLTSSNNIHKEYIK